jgi:hypothetical protein
MMVSSAGAAAAAAVCGTGRANNGKKARGRNIIISSQAGFASKALQAMRINRK